MMRDPSPLLFMALVSSTDLLLKGMFDDFLPQKRMDFFFPGEARPVHNPLVLCSREASKAQGKLHAPEAPSETQNPIGSRAVG